VRELFRGRDLEAGEAILDCLVVLVDGVLVETVVVGVRLVLYSERVIERGGWGSSTYAFSRVVLRNVALQVSHWISFAASFYRRG